MVTFEYEDWDDLNDLLLERPGSTIGYGAVNSSLELRMSGENREPDREPVVKESVDGIIELIAGGLEWLRRFGMSAEEVQSRVRAYKQRKVALPSQVVAKNALRATYEIPVVAGARGPREPNKLVDL